MSIKKVVPDHSAQSEEQVRKDNLWNVQEPGDPYDIRKFISFNIDL